MLTADTVEDANHVVTLAAGAYADAAGNPGTASTSGNDAIENDDDGGAGGGIDRTALRRRRLERNAGR